MNNNHKEYSSFKTKLVGSTIIVTSGLLLYLDKVLAFFNIESDITFGYSNFNTFVWVLMQSTAPILMILGSFFNPYRYSYSIVIYCYLVQILWIFSPQSSDDFLFSSYAISLAIISISLVYIISKVVILLKRKKNKDREFINDAKDVLAMLKTKVLDSHKTQSV